MDNFDLDTVLKKARNLDTWAMGQLCEHYYPRVLKFMYYRVSPEKAEDLTGEVFLKVMRSIEKQSGHFEAWLFKIARNTIIDDSRHKKVRPEVELQQETLKHQFVKNSGIGIVNSKLDIQYALQQLNEEQRELITLKFIQGLDNSEIAEITGKNAGAIRAMQLRALRALREILRGDGK